MKHATLAITLLATVACLLASCRTSEENYKQSYEKAVERTRENMGQATYDLEQAERMRANQVVNGDTVRLVTTFCTIVDGDQADMKPYGIVVGEFDQVINARSYRDRLHSKEGFESYIAYTSHNKKYNVVVQGFDSREQAAAYLKNLPQFMKMKVLVPRAWILERR